MAEVFQSSTVGGIKTPVASSSALDFQCVHEDSGASSIHTATFLKRNEN